MKSAANKVEIQVYVFLLALLVLLRIFFKHSAKKKGLHRRRPIPIYCALQTKRFPQAKPDWVRHEIIALYLKTGASARKLAAMFNRLYEASAKMTVGKTWVRETIKAFEYEKILVQRACKNKLPMPLPRNRCWGADTTTIRDLVGVEHYALGVIDHGTRKAVTLQQIEHFNQWTFLGNLFLTIGQSGKPDSIKMDNHPVFKSKLVRKILTHFKIKCRYSEPGKPWQNGRIERFFGTLKSQLKEYAIRDSQHLGCTLEQFQYWYNAIRPHQHLQGRTPNDAWENFNPFKHAPKLADLFSTWEEKLKGIRLRY